MAFVLDIPLSSTVTNFGDLLSLFGLRMRGHELTSAAISHYINSAYDNFINEADFLIEDSTTTILTTPGSRYADLPEDVFAVTAVRNATLGHKLGKIDGHRTPYTMYPDPDSETGPPEHYKPHGAQLVLLPTPDSVYTLEITYRRPAPRLLAPTDVPLLPGRYRAALVDGALALAHMDDGNNEAAALHQEFFNNAVRQAVKELVNTAHETYPSTTDDFYEGI